MTRYALISLAGWLAFAGNLALSCVKIACGAVSGSLAVLGDGLDSACDVGIAFITLAVSRIIARPSDRGHPWGHGRAETTATLALSFALFFSGAQLCVSAVRRLASPAPPAAALSALALAVTGASIAGKLLLALSQAVLGRKAASAMVLANARNMASDVAVSAAVLAGLLVSRYWYAPRADAAAALLVGLWIIKNAARTFLEANTELMDGLPGRGTEPYRRLFDAVRTVSGVDNPHRVRIRRIAGRFDIDLDIEVPGDITVAEAHERAGKVERALHEALPDIYDVMVHIEPGGETAREPEQYGLSERDIAAR